jgi:hypothetical protein
MKILEITTNKMDRNTELMRDLVQQEIDKKNLKTPQEIKKYILGLKLTGLIQYKEDVITLLQHFGIQVKLNAEAGGGGGAGGGAGSGAGAGGSSAGASAGGNGGSTGSSGDGGSAGSGDTGSSDSASTSSSSVGTGFVGIGTYMPGAKRKKKKKKSNIPFGKGVYKESLDNYLMDLQFAVKEVVNITKKIKYADMHTEIIREVEQLAEKYNVQIDEYDIDQIYKAKNNLESKIFELEQAFKDKIRSIKNKIDDENI